MADKKNETKITAAKIKADYRRAKTFDSKWSTEADEDLKFALGDQWETEDKEALKKTGRLAITFNIIQSLIFLISGYQRQSRTSIRAYPEGGEDQLKSEIVTRLIKHVIKRSRAQEKESETFENSLITGKGFKEPYTDYTHDLITGELQFNVSNPHEIVFDARSTEYDLSDARYVVKRTIRCRDELVSLHPDHEAEIDAASKYSGEYEKKPEEDILAANEDYPNAATMASTGTAIVDGDEGSEDLKEDEWELFEYYYKKYVTKFLAVDVDIDKAQIFDTEEQGTLWLKQTAAENGNVLPPEAREGRTAVKKIHIPEIHLAICVGDKVLEDDYAPTFPRWKGYPIIPTFAHYTALAKKRLKRSDLAYQGIVRSLKDAQREKNKRRSQSLHIINSTANAGWIYEEGAWVNPEMVKQFGTTPGVHLEYKKGFQKPERINPASPPSGHFMLENEAEEDIKKISGINADLLAMEDKTSSGRAIALRQQQGMLMIRRVFDNLSWTQELTGRFIVSQLPDLFTADKAMKVLGSQFIQENFKQADTDSPQVIVMKAQTYLQALLKDDEIAKFDISVGEGIDSPTMRYSIYSMLMELSDKYPGVIPPDILVEYSDLPPDAQQKVVGRFQAAQAAQAAQTGPAPAAGGGSAPRLKGAR